MINVHHVVNGLLSRHFNKMQCHLPELMMLRLCRLKVWPRFGYLTDMIVPKCDVKVWTEQNRAYFYLWGLTVHDIHCLNKTFNTTTYTWQTIIINLHRKYISINHKVFIKRRAKSICKTSFSINLLVKINNLSVHIIDIWSKLHINRTEIYFL